MGEEVQAELSGVEEVSEEANQLAEELTISGYSSEQIDEIMENIHSTWPRILYS